MSRSTAEAKRGLYLVGLGEAKEVLVPQTRNKTESVARSLRQELMQWDRVQVTVEDLPVVPDALQAFDDTLHPDEEAHRKSPIAKLPIMEPEQISTAIQDKSMGSLVKEGLAVQAFRDYMSYIGELLENPRVSFSDMALIRLGSPPLMGALLKSGIDHEPIGDFRQVVGALSIVTTPQPDVYRVGWNGARSLVRLEQGANRFKTLPISQA